MVLGKRAERKPGVFVFFKIRLRLHLPPVIKRSCSELQLSPEGVSLGIMAVVVGVADSVRSHVQLGEAE